MRLQCRRHGFHPCVGQIPWRREWQPSKVLLHGGFHGKKSLFAIVHGVAKSWAQLSDWHFHWHFYTFSNDPTVLGCFVFLFPILFFFFSLCIFIFSSLSVLLKAVSYLNLVVVFAFTFQIIFMVCLLLSLLTLDLKLDMGNRD